LRTDLALRWEAGDRIGAGWYLQSFPELDEDSSVALVYEEFCLLEEDGSEPEPTEFLTRYPALAEPLRRVLDIHGLIGSATPSDSMMASGPSVALSLSPASAASARTVSFPEAGQTIGGFHLVEELGRGAFARVFLARERQLADRPVALKVTRKRSREPQALARLQHTHIVPVHSHRVDPATGLHLLCMPYFGRITLAQVLTEIRQKEQTLSGAALVATLNRLSDGGDQGSTVQSACRLALNNRSYAQAIAWWAARLAEALEHAHDRGVLHRDIKPSNVLLNDDGMPMLLDFNLAREPVFAGDEPAEAPEATLGGTVDYMSPEHLDALAEGVSDRLDGRVDIYAMGVLLFEALVGDKPFVPPRKGQSVIDSLLRAAEERRRDPTKLFVGELPIPIPLQAVICRCIEPEPCDRYRTAGELAADLRAVADDLPLLHAREPLHSRINRRLRRNRRSLAGTAAALFAAAAILGAYFNVQMERHDRYNEVSALLLKGEEAFKDGKLEQAQIWLANAAGRAHGSDRSILRNLLKLDTIWDFGGKLRDKLKKLWTFPTLDDLEAKIRVKAFYCGQELKVRRQADKLLDESESLRFRFIGLGEDIPGAVDKLKTLLEPFYVLNSKKELKDLEYVWNLLDNPRRTALKHEVDELLFHWMVKVLSSLRKAGETGEDARIARDPTTLEQALNVCDRGMTFAEAAHPWQALRTLLEASHGRTGPAQEAPGAVPRPAGEPPRFGGEPDRSATENSATACFQWGLLHSSVGHSRRAIDWMERAVTLDSGNYWYLFYLAYLEDLEGLSDEAQIHYSSAVARRPSSPWVRFSAARLSRERGRWDRALNDFKQAQELLRDRPEAPRIALELGLLYFDLGEFQEAAREYREVIKIAPESPYARAARLNLANIDAESGRTDAARRAYSKLLASDSGDRAARLSRALLFLRLNQPIAALEDLKLLLKDPASPSDRADVLAAAAMANLLLHRGQDATDFALKAAQAQPSLTHERVLQRSLLAARRYDQLQLGRPEEVLLLPAPGALLVADLRIAAAELAPRTQQSDADAYRAACNRAVILSALGEHRNAREAADRALAIAPLSPEVRLIRARVLHRAADRKGAQEEIDAGLLLSPKEPGLLELHGVLLAETGDLAGGLAFLKQAISLSPNPFARFHLAAVEVAQNHDEEAVHDWTLALQSDPELPQAYLGRARSFVRLLKWDRALADLELAAAWSHGNLRLQLGVMLTYASCLPERPGLLGRWLLLLSRAAHQACDELTGTSVSTGMLR
jgi:serine/threonine protein kinase/Tfp pilus assembly protein PilF